MENKNMNHVIYYLGVIVVVVIFMLCLPDYTRKESNTVNNSEAVYTVEACEQSNSESLNTVEVCERSFVTGTVVNTYKESQILLRDLNYIIVEDEADNSRRFEVRVNEPTYIVGDKVIIHNDFGDHWIISSEEEKEEYIQTCIAELEEKKVTDEMANIPNTKTAIVHYVDGTSEEISASQIVKSGKFYSIRVENGTRWIPFDEVDNIEMQDAIVEEK